MTKVVVSVLLIVALVAVLASTASGAIRFAKIQYNSPGAENGSNRSLNGEWFTITNTAAKKKSLTNWSVRDKSGHIYRFGTFTLRGHKTVKVHTGRGNTSGLRRYWGLRGYVWGNRKDKAWLKTPSGHVVDTCSYNAPSKSVKVCTAVSRDLLPDAVMMDLRPVTFSVDTTTMPDHTLLRFTAETANIGRGPMELRGSRPDTASTMSVRQRIYKQGGGFRSRSVPGHMFWATDGHEHWHVAKYVTTELRTDPAGTKVADGAKLGFCLTDTRLIPGVPLPGAPGSAAYHGCASGGKNSLAVTMGTSVGWTDRYGSRLPFQWIDITDVPPGQYKLTATVDKQNYYRESNETNNSTSMIVELPLP